MTIIRPTRRTRFRALVVLTVAGLAASACGGDDADPAVVGAQEAADEPAADEPAADEPAADEPAADDTVTEEPATGEVQGPVSTLSPEVPEIYLEALGPVDVVGAAIEYLPRDGDDPAIGQPVPVLVGLDLDGDPIRIDPATDGPTMVVFVAHWCPHCNEELPKLNELRDAGRFPEGLNIVAVNTAVAPDRPNWPPAAWLTETMGWTYPAMRDGVDIERGEFVAADAYGVSGFPFIALVDGDGIVRYRWTGEREPDEVIEYLDEHLSLS